MKNTAPKYARIEQHFIDQIKSGELQPEDELPSESELMQQFHVSRVTARRAMDELYRAGYVEKEQGKRAYVKSASKYQELSTISSYTEEILRQGMTPSRDLLCSKLRICTQEEQEKLKLQKADPVYYMERIYYADAKPLCYTCTTLPYYIFRDIETYDFVNNSLYDIIEQHYGVTLVSTALKLKAVSSCGILSERLKISNKIPLLHSSAVTTGIYKGKEVPVEMFTTDYLTERFEYCLTQFRK